MSGNKANFFSFFFLGGGGGKREELQIIYISWQYYNWANTYMIHSTSKHYFLYWKYSINLCKTDINILKLFHENLVKSTFILLIRARQLTKIPYQIFFLIWNWQHFIYFEVDGSITGGNYKNKNKYVYSKKHHL